MHHFENKNSKIFSPEGLHEIVWGPGENVFLGPAVALDGPGRQVSDFILHETVNNFQCARCANASWTSLQSFKIKLD